MTTLERTAERPTDPAPRTPVWRVAARQLGPAVRLLIIATLVLGLVYPLAIWGVSRLPGLESQAEGSLTATGSSLIGIDPVAANPAADPWFHTRPSASATATDGLGPANPTTSGGSNLATTSTRLAQLVAARRAAIAAREDVTPAAVPDDAVTASASGLDPDISPAYAELQVPRVARVTGLPVAQVQALVARATDGRVLGILGEPTVNVPVLDAELATTLPGLR